MDTRLTVAGGGGVLPGQPPVEDISKKKQEPVNEKAERAAQPILNTGSPEDIKGKDLSDISAVSINKAAAAEQVGAAAATEAERPPATIIPFGTLLGVSDGVKAYSNGTAARISKEPSEDAIGRYSGMKWQCVEYGRRYMQDVENFTFGDVYGAHNIWDLEETTNLKDNSVHSFLSLKNGHSKELPVQGSLLIYPLQEDCPYGHVAAIVSVDFDEKSGKGHVRIGEQNWANASWEGRDYSRELQLTKDKRGNYSIIDDSEHPILGWKTIGDVIPPE